MSVLEYRSGLDEKTDPARGLSRHWLGWAIYLGMSWTWCIGMFLPVLLIRDYGVWAWVIFAAPNVVGAAAMGWVLRQGQSEKLVEQHRHAIDAFSFVTATFQIFFALWMFESFALNGPAWGMIALAVCFLLIVTGARAQSRTIGLTASTLIVSLFCMGIVGDLWRGELPLQGDASALTGLAFTCILGFGLCPYLDATFHRARQAMPSGRLAFSVGFGVFFLMMILFTLMYTPLLIGWTSPMGHSRLRAVSAHWMVQLALTTALHWHAMRRRWVQTVATTAVAIAIWGLLRFMRFGDFGPGELVYRLFMSFYGLVFPAYVWICMLPTWKEPLAPARRQWIALAIGVVVAAPFYWVAFIEGRMVWVVPGVLLVLAARLAVPKRMVAG